MTASPTLRLSLSIAFGNYNSWARRRLVSQSFGGGAASVDSVVFPVIASVRVVPAELELSETTVKVHRSQIMRKVRAKSLVDLVQIPDNLGVSTGQS